jgi:hypothetical protein
MLVDAFAVPVVLKAVEFLFGAAKDVLEERHAARQSSESEAASVPEIPLLNQDKEAILKHKVSEELIRQQQQLMEGTLEEIGIYQKNYQRLKKRMALEGGPEFAPISVVNQLRIQEDHILEASRRLAGILDDLIEHTES